MKMYFYTLFVTCLSFLGQAQNIQPARVMSQAYTTYADQGIAGLFSNQAGLHDLAGVSIEASALQRYFSQGVLELHLGAAIPLSDYTGAGVYVKRFGDDIFSEQSVGLAMGRQLFESFSMGIGLEVYQLNIENYGNELQFNTQIGFQADITKAVTIGTHIFLPLEKQDILSYSNQSIFNFDIAVQADEHLNIKGGVRKINEQDLGFKAALSYRPIDKFIIHTGVLTYPAHYTIGAGLELFKNLEFLATGIYQNNLGWSSGINLSYVPKK